MFAHIVRPLMAACLAALVAAPSAATPEGTSDVPALASELARFLPGSWRMEAIQPDGRARPIGTRTFSRTFDTGVIVAWEERNMSGALHSRGFVGARDSSATALFYMAAGPNLPPIAITGAASGLTRSIAWSLTPIVSPDHPYNRELVASRWDLLSPTAFDWVAPGHWHIRFRKAE